MKLPIALLALLPLSAAAQSEWTVGSPNGDLQVEVSLTAAGELRYSATLAGARIMEPSALGLVTDYADFSRGLLYVTNNVQPWKESYELPNTKQRQFRMDANILRLDLRTRDGAPMRLEMVVENDALGYRYVLSKHGERAAARVMSETSEFRFPGTTTTFLTPQSDPMIGWKRTKPSYEEEYELDAPMYRRSKFGKGYTFPGLFKIPEAGWALVSETGVSSRYCASHLSDFEGGAYHIAFPMAAENNGNGTVEPAFALPGETPWRTVALAQTPAKIAQQTITWDLVKPQYESKADVRYGKGTWSWILWDDASININDQQQFMALAESMHYPYTLVDNWWDTRIGRVGMEQLARYGDYRGVHLVVWYSSSGYWNDIEQGPVNRMDRAITRKAEMQWLKRIGAKGIKVDFFGGDKQETMRLYEDILSDADDAGLFVIFHGATLPRGWERMYPNYAGSEAVLASENLKFDQHHCDIEARSATLHPFIRNNVGCMEYGGTVLNQSLSKDNRSGTVRRTDDAFQLATAVLFQNPVQFFALVPDNLQSAPREALDFLKKVPTTWDETRVLDGYPGKYVVLARRSGEQWYVAAVNGDINPLEVDVELPQSDGTQMDVYHTSSGQLQRSLSTKKGRTTIELQPNSGIVFVTAPKAL